MDMISQDRPTIFKDLHIDKSIYLYLFNSRIQTSHIICKHDSKWRSLGSDTRHEWFYERSASCHMRQQTLSPAALQ